MNHDFLIWISGAGLLLTLAWLASIDLETYRLPNKITMPLIAGGLLYHFIMSLDSYPYLLGAVLGYAIFWTVETGYRLIRKRDGLGRGDAKLLAAGGAWCGAMALPFIILMASSAALIVVLMKPKSERATLKLAFGPYLAGAIAIIFIAMRMTGNF
ncbi:prepilin peptidase [Litorimonas sp. WD9-15]|uniref:prepilin peptidase n=1 Tax=Litorimonas sp. WD9-15 TaxID=3418716 RepID=UPI003D064FD9